MANFILPSMPKVNKMKKNLKTRHRFEFSVSFDCSLKISEMDPERQQVSQVFHNTTFNSSELNFVRSAQPSTDNYNGVITAPFTLRIQFWVGHPVRLTALKLMRQFNKDLPSQLYTEEVQIELQTNCGAVINKASFGPQQIEFGPGNFEVRFSKQLTLFTNKQYMLVVNLLRSGSYLHQCRSMNSHCEGISASFSGVGQGKGLLHSLVCKRA